MKLLSINRIFHYFDILILCFIMLLIVMYRSHSFKYIYSNNFNCNFSFLILLSKKCILCPGKVYTYNYISDAVGLIALL